MLPQSASSVKVERSVGQCYVITFMQACLACLVAPACCGQHRLCSSRRSCLLGTLLRVKARDAEWIPTWLCHPVSALCSCGLCRMLCQGLLRHSWIPVGGICRVSDNRICGVICSARLELS